MHFSENQSRQFERYIFKFAQRHQLFPKQGRTLWLAVSGGRDSMCLAFLANQLNVLAGSKYAIKVAHMNHGTRPFENAKEQKLVEKFADKLEMEVRVRKLKGPPSQGLELWARNQRYKFFDELMERGDRFWLAHHLDDSFEWSLMKRFSGSSLQSHLGIPLWYRAYARPLLCTTRKQLIYYQRCRSIPYLTDSSNLKSIYERNWLRNEILESLNRRYPNSLKHFVASSRQLHSLLVKPTLQTGLSLLASDNTSKVFARDKGIKPTEIFIKSNIHSLSSKKRGLIVDQVQKSVSLIEKGDGGPLSFSGGVHLFSQTGIFFLSKSRNPFETLSRFYEQAKIWKEISPSEFSKRIKKADGKGRCLVWLDTQYPENFSPAWLSKRPKWMTFCGQNHYEMIDAIRLLKFWSRQTWPSQKKLTFKVWSWCNG